MSTPANKDRSELQTAMVGNPMLAQVRDFIDQDDAPASIDPVGIIVRALRGRVTLVILVTLLIALVSAVGTYLAVNPIYQSSGMLRILPTEGKILYSDRDDSRLRLYDTFFNTEMRLLTSRPTLEGALQKLYQIEDRAFPVPEDVGNLDSMISVSGTKGLISLASRSSEPELSAAVVNAVIASYQESNEANRNRTYDVRREELGARESELEASLAELNDQYLAIGEEHDASTLAKAHVAKTAQLEVIEERIAELENTITQMQLTGAAGAGVGNGVEIQRATLLDQAMADMTFERAQRLAALETLKGRYQPSHPRLSSAQVELDILEGAIDERLNQIALLGQAGALAGGGSNADEESLDDLRGAMEGLTARRDEVRNEAAELNSKLVRIRGIATEMGRVEELLAETKRALDEVLVESQNDLSRSVEIIALGKVPKGPIEDKRKPLALGAMVFSALAWLTLFLAWNVLGGRVRFSDDLQSRSSDVLAAVIMQDANPEQSFRQAARKLRNELDLRWPQRGSGSLVIALLGTGKEAGTTSVANTLGTQYAQAGFDVLVVDADPGNSGLSRLFENSLGNNVTTTKSTKPLKKGILKIGDGNSSRYLLPSSAFAETGPDQSDPGELALDEMNKLLTSAREDYNVIILDLGVLAAGRQSAVGAVLSDHSVLVVACGDSRKEIDKAQDLLDRLTPTRYLLTLNRASHLDPALVSLHGRYKSIFPFFLAQFKNRLKPSDGV